MGAAGGFILQSDSELDSCSNGICIGGAPPAVLQDQVMCVYHDNTPPNVAGNSYTNTSHDYNCPKYFVHS